jgi:hypothetical protein
VEVRGGTPNIAGAVGLRAAIDYLDAIGPGAVSAHEGELLAYATEEVGRIPGVRIVGTAREKAGILSFVVEGVHPHDVGTILDHEGIAIRTGHHCAMPLMDRLGLPATARASFGLYNAGRGGPRRGIRKAGSSFDDGRPRLPCQRSSSIITAPRNFRGSPTPTVPRTATTPFAGPTDRVP